MIELKNLTKTYTGRGTEHEALKGVTLTIDDGEIFGVIGTSGAGKSTLIRCINLLENPTSGQVVIDGKDVTNYKGKDLLNLRESIGMIFQHFSLFQQRTVLKNVMFPLEISKNSNKAENIARAKELLEIVGLSGYEDRYPSQLSGGQQQRVAIARALANNPKIMLCDEATSALDTQTTASILNLLQDINERLGVTIVLITHSLDVAKQICDRVAVISEGLIVEEGPTHEVFDNPQVQATKDLIAFSELDPENSRAARKARRAAENL